MDQVKIGKYLKCLRKEKGLTQAQVAEQLGVSDRTISRWENGSGMPDISLLVEIAELYETTIPEIINGERKSEGMNEEVKEVAEKMADYAAAEKEKIIGDVQKQSIIGVIVVAGLLVVELLGLEENTIVGHIHVYLQTLAYVSVFMVFVFSTGLSYRINRNNKLLKLPKVIQIVIAVVAAVAIAVILKCLLSVIGL